MGGSFEFLEHPSDIGILGRGDSRSRALIEASNALTNIIVDPAGIQPIEERQFHAVGTDVATQVITWLNEIIFFFDAEGLVFSEFVIDSWGPRSINGRARGERINLDRHTLRTAVKAPTYHQFSMEETPSGWELRVFLDV